MKEKSHRPYSDWVDPLVKSLISLSVLLAGLTGRQTEHSVCSFLTLGGGRMAIPDGRRVFDVSNSCARERSRLGWWKLTMIFHLSHAHQASAAAVRVR